MGFAGANALFGGNFGGTALSSALSFVGANRANDAAHDLSAEQFSWYRQHENRRYERTVNDLRRAGLNPMLAVSGGMTPGGGSMPGTASMHNPFADASSAVALRRQKAEIENIREDTQKKKAEKFTQDNLGALYAKEHQIKNQVLHTAKAAAAEADIERKFFKQKKGKFFKALDIMGRSLNPFTSSGKNAAGALK